MVQHICDEIAVMYLGVVVEKTNRKTLFRNPRHPYTRALLSAVPARHGSRKTERIRLEGDIPSPVNVPSGCRFHTRCAHAQERCRVEVPTLVEKAPGHWEAVSLRYIPCGRCVIGEGGIGRGSKSPARPSP